MRFLFLVACAGALACSPDVFDTGFQDYSISLWGPSRGADDPFEASAEYEVTLRFFEDAAGGKPYGASLSEKQRGEAFKDFKPSMTIRRPANATSFSLAEALGDEVLALPGLVDESGEPRALDSFFLSAEVVGLDSEGNRVARARCPIAEIKQRKTTAGAVTCKAFFGFVGRWNPIGGPAEERRDFGAAVLPDGRVIVAGGRTTVDGAPIQTVEIFDPEGAPSDAWSIVGRLGTARYGLTATAVANGSVVFAGGRVSEQDYSNALDFFDPSEGGAVVPSTRALEFARSGHLAAALDDETVLIAAGYSSPTSAVQRADRLKLGAVPGQAANSKPRRGGCMTQVEENFLLLCGGGQTACEVFDGNAFSTVGEWRIEGRAPEALACAGVEGDVFLVGGVDTQNAMDVYRWQKGGGAPSVWARAPRLTEQHGIAVAGGKIVVSGGALLKESRKMARRDGFYFAPGEEGAVVELAGESLMKAARAGHALVGLPDGTVMAIGGTDGSDKFAELFVVP